MWYAKRFLNPPVYESASASFAKLQTRIRASVLAREEAIFEKGRAGEGAARCWTLLLMMMYLMTTKDEREKERGEDGDERGAEKKTR